MKKLSLFVLFAYLFSGVGFAEEATRSYVISSFEKGLNDHASPYVVGDNQGTIAQNVRFNNAYGTVAKRPSVLNYGTIGSSAAVNGLYRYYKSDGTKKLIAASSTKLYVGDDTAGTFQTIKTGLTDGKRWQFSTYKDILIASNGYDNTQKYDGKTLITDDTEEARTATAVTADLGAPFAELDTGSNLDATSWYTWRIAYYDGSTYIYSTARTNALKTGSTFKAAKLTDVPLGPTGTTTRYIYRTEGQASQAAAEAATSYYQVGSIADNTTTTYIDNVADATITADAAPTWATVSAGVNGTPPKGKYNLIHKERLFATGNNTDPSNIYWSDLFNPDVFDPTDYVSIRRNDGDAITFLKEQLGILTVGKTNTIQKFYTEGDTSTWQASAPLSFVGCPAPYSVANTPVGIFYVGRDGLYNFNGQYSSLISDAVTPKIRDILEVALDNAWGMWFKNEYQLAYTSRSTGATHNDRVLVYDTTRDAYSVDTRNVNCFATFSSGTDFGILYEGASDTTGRIFAQEAATPILIKNLKSELDAGTFSATVSSGEETSPVLSIGEDETIDGGSAGTIDTETGIIDRLATSGTWTSPAYQINATGLTLLQWNEDLNSYGDVTFQIRTGATLGALAAASYSSSFTNPAGSDISAVTASVYIQVKISLSTSDITVTPELYVNDGYMFKITYERSGDEAETTIPSIWESGWRDFQAPGFKKWIRRIKVFYRGTDGTMTVNYRNDQDDVDNSFTIDLSQDPSANTVTLGEDNYQGDNTNKIYVHYTPANTATQGAPVGQFWKLNITESGTTVWNVDKIEVLYAVEPINN
jgi:hypothetical protein